MDSSSAPVLCLCPAVLSLRRTLQLSHALCALSAGHLDTAQAIAQRCASTLGALHQLESGACDLQSLGLGPEELQQTIACTSSLLAAHLAQVSQPYIHPCGLYALPWAACIAWHPHVAAPQVLQLQEEQAATSEVCLPNASIHL
jgi:hypothetical protein